MTEQRTAPRAKLSPDWQASWKRLDWMHVPGMADYVNGLVSDEKLAEGGHWALYANKMHLSPLAERLGRPLTVASLGCRDCRIEAALIRDFGWPVRKLYALEYDAHLRSAAMKNLADLNVNAQSCFFDFNRPEFNRGPVDVVFCCHAIHHANDLEKLLPFINGLLRPDSLLIGIDYFGPTRFQVEYEVREIIQKIDGLLPPELKADLRRETPDAVDIKFASVKEVRDSDIYKAVRSSDLRTLLFSNFPVIELKSMGGTLLRWLFQYRAGNFSPTNPLHVSIANLLIYIEKMLISTKQIRSDDLFFVCGRSNTL